VIQSKKPMASTQPATPVSRTASASSPRSDGFKRAAALVYDFFFRLAFLRGTLAPARRASDRPMAMACLRLVTFFFERPLRNVPVFRSCIARLTLLAAFFP
jgi:hypothetical protein